MVFGKRIDEPGGARHAVREVAMLRAAIMTVTDSHSVDLLDVSKTGAKVRGRELPAPGQEVLILIGKLEAFGRVVWRDHDQCGVHFDIALGDNAFETVKSQCAPSYVLATDPDSWLVTGDWQSGFVR
jgi:hypothetical protein